MGSLKGKPHRQFTAEEKEAYVKEYLKEPQSQRQYALKVGLVHSVFNRWLAQYLKEGKAGLASHRDRCGNPYAALHTSKTLDERERLQLRMAKLEADVARLKKGYWVKGDGLKKEFVTCSGKNFRSSKS